MKLIYVGIIIAGLVVWYLLTRSRESFVPEFLEQSSVRKTASMATSSYTQDTNHSAPVPGPNVPIQGTESPFRVNMFNAYVP